MSIGIGIENAGYHIGAGISGVGAGITSFGNSVGLGVGLGMACIALAIYLSSKNKK